MVTSESGWPAELPTSRLGGLQVRLRFWTANDQVESWQTPRSRTSARWRSGVIRWPPPVSLSEARHRLISGPFNARSCIPSARVGHGEPARPLPGRAMAAACALARSAQPAWATVASCQRPSVGSGLRFACSSCRLGRWYATIPAQATAALPPGPPPASSWPPPRETSTSALKARCLMVPTPAVTSDRPRELSPPPGSPQRAARRISHRTQTQLRPPVRSPPHWNND